MANGIVHRVAFARLTGYSSLAEFGCSRQPRCQQQAAATRAPAIDCRFVEVSTSDNKQVAVKFLPPDELFGNTSRNISDIRAVRLLLAGTVIECSDDDAMQSNQLRVHANVRKHQSCDARFRRIGACQKLIVTGG